MFYLLVEKHTESALPDLIKIELKSQRESTKLIDEVCCALQLKNNTCLHIESQQSLLILLTQLS